MAAYLLDTNHVEAWERKDPRFVAHLSEVPPENWPRVSAITLGELEAGMRMTATTNPARRAQFRQFVNDELLTFAIPVDDTVAHSYAEIMGRIWKAHPPSDRKVSTDEHLLKKGVDINDVWVVAVAMHYRVTLLTEDAMKILRDVTPEVAFDNWLI